MKRLLALLVAWVLVSPALAESVPYESAEGGFTLSHPAEWTEKPANNSNVLVTFTSALAGADDTFAENVNVIARDLPPGTAAATNVDQIVDAAKPIVLKHMGGTEVSDEQTTVGGQRARKIVLDAQLAGRQCRMSQWYVMNGERMYIISYTAQTESPAALNDAAAGIVGSMRFIKAATTGPATTTSR